ncbi:hypothetical protein Ocin01_06368 [Orchesella cincta]|uniref:Uncharacterized protein n=1 Tax=Orchesella cincta TaxID=48709 RepID=A0A1D2N505_ORCCI|nr:hypothetical protein Ocin01_06368 [Orchesella cincta]
MADENSPSDAQNLLSEDAAGPSEEEWTEEEEEQVITKPGASAGTDLDSHLDFLRSLITTVDTPTPPPAPPTYDEEEDEEEEEHQHRFTSGYPEETTGEEEDEDEEEEGFYEHEYDDNEIVELFSPLLSPDGNYNHFEQEMRESGESDEVEDDAFDEYDAKVVDEDTIPQTGNAKQTESEIDITLAPTGGADVQSSAERPSPNKNKKDMSKRSFRWFERQLLYPLIPKPNDEGLRRKQLLEKCQMVRKVSKPVVTLLGAPKSFIASQDVAQGSKDSLNETDVVTKSFKDFTNFDWAMKNTQDFLTNAGCTESSSRTYRSSLKAVNDDKDIRLKIYEKQLKRRRNAIGSREQAPEITAALLRHAQRAVWRAVIDNTKPRYPLPRFIFTRHRYLKRVQAQFIGPGSYEHDVFHSQTKARQQKMPSTWATCNPRFPKDPAEAAAKGGAGAVHLLDPWESLDKANYQKKHPGTCVPFESTPQNFRKSTEAGSKIPPNAYNIKSPLEEFIKQKTSLRGPYDCYTPSRAVIPYGHYQTTTDEDKSRLGPGSYEVRSSLVKEMNDPYNFFKAKFGKAERNKMFGFKAAFDKPLWPKDNGIPPVGHYEGDTEIIGKDRRQYKAPFKVLAGLKKRDENRELVAPDYYYFNGTWTVPPKGADLASVFLSKSPQIMPSKLHHVRKERNRAMNRFCDPLGRHKEEHYAYDIPVKNDYVLEDCKYQCSGPKVDPYGIPGHGVVNATGKSGCCGCG